MEWGQGVSQRIGDDEELWWALPRDNTAPGDIRELQRSRDGAVAYKTQTQHDTLGFKESRQEFHRVQIMKIVYNTSRLIVDRDKPRNLVTPRGQIPLSLFGFDWDWD